MWSAFEGPRCPRCSGLCGNVEAFFTYGKDVLSLIEGSLEVVRFFTEVQEGRWVVLEHSVPFYTGLSSRPADHRHDLGAGSGDIRQHEIEQGAYNQ